MVAEALPDLGIPADGTSAAAPPPDSAVSLPVDSSVPQEDTGLLDAGKGQDAAAQAPPPEETPEPPATLESAQEKVRRFRAGESKKLDLTRDEQGLLDREADRQASLENLTRQQDKDYREYVRGLETKFTTEAQGLTATVQKILEDAGVELSWAQAQLLEREIDGRFGGLKDDVASTVTEPITATARDVMRSVLVEHTGMSDREARRLVHSLPLISAPNPQTGEYDESLLLLALNTGFAAGQKQGPRPGTVTLTEAELATKLKGEREAAERAIRAEGTSFAQGSGGGATGSNGVPSMAQWTAFTIEEREARRKADPNIELRIAGVM